MPAPTVCQVRVRKNHAEARPGLRAAKRKMDAAIKTRGNLSLKRPTLTTIFFLTGMCPTYLAISSCGRYRPAPAMAEMSPMSSRLSVRWLTYSGMIVLGAAKLKPNQKSAPSATLTPEIPAKVALDFGLER